MIALLPCMSALSLELSPWAVLAFRMSTSSRCLLERPVQDHTVFIVPGQWEFQIWKYKMQVRRSASLGAICGNFRHSEDFFSRLSLQCHCCRPPLSALCLPTRYSMLGPSTLLGRIVVACLRLLAASPQHNESPIVDVVKVSSISHSAVREVGVFHSFRYFCPYLLRVLTRFTIDHSQASMS